MKAWEVSEALAEGCAAAWGWMAAECATEGEFDGVRRRIGYAIEYAREAGSWRAFGEAMAREDEEYRRQVARGVGP